MMLEDENLVTSSTIGQSSLLDSGGTEFGANLDSPSNFFKCIYDSAAHEVFATDAPKSILPQNGALGSKLSQHLSKNGSAGFSATTNGKHSLRLDVKLECDGGLSPVIVTDTQAYHYSSSVNGHCVSAYANGDNVSACSSIDGLQAASFTNGCGNAPFTHLSQSSTPPMLPSFANGCSQRPNGHNWQHDHYAPDHNGHQRAATTSSVSVSSYVLPDSSTPSFGSLGGSNHSNGKHPNGNCNGVASRFLNERRTSEDSQTSFGGINSSVCGGNNNLLLDADSTKVPVANRCSAFPSAMVDASTLRANGAVAAMNGTDFAAFVGSSGVYEAIKREAAFVSTHDLSSVGNNISLNGVANQKTFVACKVCGDKASGYHYGVTSCEGCKGFFRRSIQKQIEYRCLRDGKCVVFRLNRNRCQYCRFKKCLAVGMSRDSVRYGRVPKRSRDRMQDDTRVSSMTGDTEQDAELERKQLAIYDVILSVSQAHHSNCAYTEDKIKNLNIRPLIFPIDRCILNDNDPVQSSDLLERHKIVMWETLASYTTSEIQRVVEFAKRVPGFSELQQDDQLILIKSGFFEIWLVRICRMFNPQHGTVTLADGHFVTREQLEIVYHPELVNVMQNFSISFNNLHLNDGEVGLFTAVVLLATDRLGLSDPKAIERLQEKLIEALKLQLSRSHSSDPQVFPNLLLKLSELRSLGAKHNDVLGWYRMNWHRIKLPPLYAEVYDIPKSEESFVSLSSGNHSHGAALNGHGQLNGHSQHLPLPVCNTPTNTGHLCAPTAMANLPNGTAYSLMHLSSDVTSSNSFGDSVGSSTNDLADSNANDHASGDW